MYYIYILNSLVDKDRRYVGYTYDIKERLNEHNEGKCRTTAKARPWKLVSYIYFDNQQKALAFEKYLKSGSGRSFAKGHF